jgi:hypothetical protein
MQHRLKAASGVARAQIVPAELLLQLLEPADNADAALDVGLGGMAAATLADHLKTAVRRCPSRAPPDFGSTPVVVSP